MSGYLVLPSLEDRGCVSAHHGCKQQLVVFSLLYSHLWIKMLLGFQLASMKGSEFLEGTISADSASSRGREEVVNVVEIKMEMKICDRMQKDKLWFGRGTLEWQRIVVGL